MLPTNIFVTTFNTVKNSFVSLIQYNKVATLIVFGIGAVIGHVL